MSLGDLTVKIDEGHALKSGVRVQLTRIEFRLLCHFASNPNRVWSRSQLLEHVWGYPYDGDGRVVDTHIARLHAKIEDDPTNPLLHRDSSWSRLPNADEPPRERISARPPHPHQHHVRAARAALSVTLSGVTYELSRWYLLGAARTSRHVR